MQGQLHDVSAAASTEAKMVTLSPSACFVCLSQQMISRISKCLAKIMQVWQGFCSSHPNLCSCGKGYDASFFSERLQESKVLQNWNCFLLVSPRPAAAAAAAAGCLSLLAVAAGGRLRSAVGSRQRPAACSGRPRSVAGCGSGRRPAAAGVGSRPNAALALAVTGRELWSLALQQP